MKWRLLWLSAILALAWWGWGIQSRDGVVVCDVGQGNGAIIMSGRTQVLVDTGPDNGKMLQCLEKYLPAGDKEIETVIISHGDTDHSGGLEKIKNYYQIEHIYSSEEIRKNDVLRFGKFEIEILWPKEIRGDSNMDSIVARVSYGNNIFLLMGDVPLEVEQEMVWRGELKGAVKVLVAGHHGSKSATSLELLDTVKPEEVIISVGKNNRFGHPNQETIDKLKQRNIKIFRTDEMADWERWF